MSGINFQPVLSEMRDVLRTNFLIIPRFQRPFSWKAEHLEDFWRDAIGDNDPGYFVGPMVVYPLKDRQGIVDGQQRVTTVSLALRAVRNAFARLGKSQLSEAIDAYLRRENDDGDPRFILESASAGPYLAALLDDRSAYPKATTVEQRDLRKAAEELDNSLTESIVGLDTTSPDADTDSEAVAELKQIRDKLLGLRVIWIELESEDDAYIIFETLNSRGMDLEVVDLLKNHLLQAVRAEGGDLDSARDLWREMRAELEERGANANANRYLLHWWLARNDYTAERKLFRQMRKAITKKNAKSELVDLHSDSERYAWIANPEGWKPKATWNALRDSLIALNLFNVSQPRPFLLALLNSLNQGDIPLALAKKSLSNIESLHFVVTAVVGTSSTGGVSQMYAKHARDLTAATSLKARKASLQKLFEKLDDAMSSRDTFISEFTAQLSYAEETPENRRLVAYALKRLHAQARVGVPLDPSKCEIEHLSSQSASEEWMPSIGNLVLLDGDLNNRLSAKSFSEKKAILKGYSDVYDIDDVLRAKKWGKAEVTDRGQRLAKVAYDEVWTIEP